MSTLTREPSSRVRTTSGAHPRRRRTRGGRTGRSSWWAVVFIAPAGIGLLVFYVWPVVRGIELAFQEVGPFGGSTWTGFDNFVAVFSEPDLKRALLNTLLYAGIGLLGIPIALMIAALLNTPKLRFRSAFRVAYFLPVVTMPVSVALVWRLLLNVDTGIVNATLRGVGLPGVAWLSTPVVNIVAIAFVGIWMGLGTQIIIFVAGLQGVPDSLYEAAELDGAGPVRRFFTVTVPLISPTTFLLSVLSIIGSMQVFDLLYMMIDQQTNPAYPDSRSLVSLFFEKAFVDHNQGMAAAIACVLLVIILILSGIQFALQKRWVHYE